MVVLRAETQILFVVEQVGGLVAVERNAECLQGPEGGAGVPFGRPDEEVEVVGGGNVAMRVDGDSADHDTVNAGGEKRG